MIGLALAFAAAVVAPIPIDPPLPLALRVDPPAIVEPVAPEWSRCPELYSVAIENWPGAEDDWPILDRIFWREDKCGRYPKFWVNKYGCVGVMQICPSNFRRMGVNREVLKDFATNIATGYRLCMEWVERGRSCWRPWWLGRWRP